MVFLTNTFSPMMLAPYTACEVVEVELCDIPAMGMMTSAVSHEVTAKVISSLLEEEVPFNRINLTLQRGDAVYCIIPAFRATEAREFTLEEVESAGYRCFLITTEPK